MCSNPSLSSGVRQLRESFDGVGLGRYIVKEFVEMLEGSIKIESEPGKGSTFSFTIPVGKKAGESKCFKDPAFLIILILLYLYSRPVGKQLCSSCHGL